MEIKHRCFRKIRFIFLSTSCCTRPKEEAIIVEQHAEAPRAVCVGIWEHNRGWADVVASWRYDVHAKYVMSNIKHDRDRVRL